MSRLRSWLEACLIVLGMCLLRWLCGEVDE